jgi:hypothetical protein
VSGALFDAVTSAQGAISGRSGPVKMQFAQTVYVADHVHTFEHGRAVVLHKNWNLPLADEIDHRIGIVVEDHALVQMQTLERRGHAHAEAEGTMLKHIEAHCHTFSGFVRLAERGAHRAGWPWQQLSVRYEISAFIAS